MAKIPVNAKDLAPNANLLPIEEQKVVDGIPKMVSIKYLANCTSAADKTSQRSGKGYLELTWSVYVPGNAVRTHIKDILSYDPAALFKLRNAVQAFKLNPDTLDTDDFIGLFAWVFIKHEEFKLETLDMITNEPVILKDNRIANYLGLGKPEDVEVVMGGQSTVDESDEVTFP